MKFFSFHHKPASLYRHEFHVYRDWAVILALFVVALAGIVALHIALFLTVARDTSLDNALNTSGLHSVNRTELKGAVDALQARQTLFESMQKATSSALVDPSL